MTHPGKREVLRASLLLAGVTISHWHKHHPVYVFWDASRPLHLLRETTPLTALNGHE